MVRSSRSLAAFSVDTKVATRYIGTRLAVSKRPQSKVRLQWLTRTGWPKPTNTPTGPHKAKTVQVQHQGLRRIMGPNGPKVSMLKLPGEETVMLISDMTPGPSAMNHTFFFRHSLRSRNRTRGTSTVFCAAWTGLAQQRSCQPCQRVGSCVNSSVFPTVCTVGNSLCRTSVHHSVDELSPL